jgi:hypothetical protein
MLDDEACRRQLVDPNFRSIALIPFRKLRDISLHMQRD